VCVVANGRTVVDAWAGWADEAQTRPWARETAVNVFSVGKPLVAVVVLRAGVAPESLIAEHWPEFAAAGKERATVEHAMTHQAGVPALSAPLPAGTGYDWHRMCAALAAQEPWWPPGAAHGYHVNTYGFLLGEIARRASGRGLRELLREAVGDAEIWFGGPDDDRTVADFVFTAETTGGADVEQAAERASEVLAPIRVAAYFNPPELSGLQSVNTADWRAAVIPSTNMHATARGVASWYAALLAGTALDRELLALATSEHVNGPDVVLERDQRFGLGFQLPLPERRLGHGDGVFGHFGVGGALGFADPDAGIAFAYAPNRGGSRWQNPRTQALVDAAYEALA
jgi:CubicO group peptidase (beta-lactamase class C family)